MKAIQEMFDPMIHGLERIEGECPEHGMSVITLPLFLKSRAWFCSACHERKTKEEDRQKWVRDRADNLHKIARVPRKYHGQRFEARTAEQKAVRGTVKAFRDFIAGDGGLRWAVLVLMGEVGTGKTLLASELAESLINNLSMSVRYCTAAQMISEIQSSYGVEGKSEETEIMRFVQYSVLILDEIDAKRSNENSAMLLTEIINRRYNEEKPVVVITNQPFDNLAKFVGDRVDDRLHENSFVCSFNWPSFRRQV